MNTPDWILYFKTFLCVALVGFALVIASGFWHVLFILLLLVVATCVWRARRAFIR